MLGAGHIRFVNIIRYGQQSTAIHIYYWTEKIESNVTELFIQIFNVIDIMLLVIHVRLLRKTMLACNWRVLGRGKVFSARQKRFLAR